MIGIENHGNTCYINVCLQALFFNKDLLHCMNIYKSNSILIKELSNIFNLLEKNDKSIDILEFLCEIEKYSQENNIEEYEDVNTQSDSNEFLIFLLDIIHNFFKSSVTITYKGEIKTIQDKLAIKSLQCLNTNFKNNYSFIIQLFYGQYFSVYDKSFNFEPYNHIYLDLNNQYDNIYDCMDNFVKEEIVEGKKKVLAFWSFPKYLIICFKRFNNNRKNNQLIDYPIKKLDFNKYTICFKKDSIFDLVSVINHTGNLYGGHYYMYNIINDKYFIFNDTRINECNNINKKDSYILIYRKH